MIKFQRILFPVDFSEQCVAVVPAVKAMARRFGAQVDLLHVVDLPSAWFGAPETAAWAALISAGRMREEGQIAVDRFVAKHFADFPVSAAVDEGEAGLKIADYAGEKRADLIMMPTRGYGPFRAFLLGSVTAKVLHDAHCPVWTGVHAGEIIAHPPDAWKRVLCAIDTEPRDARVLQWVADFAQGQALDVRLVHVIEGMDAMLTEERDPSLHDLLFNVARERLAEMQSRAGTHFEVCLLAGKAGRAVREAAAAHNADLVVIGRGVMQQKLGRLRSSAAAIIQQAPCPLISI